MKLRIANIARMIGEKLGEDASPVVVENAIKEFVSFLKKQIQSGETVNIRNFGTFEPYHNKTGKRVGYNFKTKKVESVPCRPKVIFRKSFPIEGDPDFVRPSDS